MSKIATVTVMACFVFHVSGALAQTSPGTKFRGVFVNMPRTELELMRLDGLEVKFDVAVYLGKMEPKLGQAAFLAKADGASCGRAVFDDRKVIKTLRLSRCFFNAEGMPFSEFAKSLVASYKLTNVSCENKQTDWGTKNGVPQISIDPECRGRAPTGEEVTIDAAAIEVSRVERAPQFD